MYATHCSIVIYIYAVSREFNSGRTRVKFATQSVIYTLNTDGKLVQSFAGWFL